MVTCFPWCESKKKIYVERGNEKMITDQAGDFFDKLTILKKYLLFTSLTYKHVNVFSILFVVIGWRKSCV